MRAHARRTSSVAALVLLVAAGVVTATQRTSLGVVHDAFRTSTAADSSAPPITPAHPDLAGYRVARPGAEIAAPVRVRVPDLEIDSRLDALGQAPDRTVAVPVDPLRAGWYAPGPRPGQPGPAVVLGHVTGRDRPGVFFRLREVRTGALVLVDRADGSTVRFRVTRLARMPKTAFPTSEVYLPTAGPELRLVTCGGSFDAAVGHYRDNVVVYAEVVT